MKSHPRHDICLLLSKVILDYQAKGKQTFSTRIWSWEDFINQPLPTEDVQKVGGDFKAVANQSNKYVRAAIKLLGAEQSTNAVLYTPQSVMDWHTNSDLVGKRIYYSYTKGNAAFMYINNQGERVIDYDNMGDWTCREFDIKGADNPLWHTIWTEKERYAFGFLVKNES